MSGLFFSTESWHPAAERISECFMFFQSKMKVNDISKYCDAIDNIGIIPFSGPDKHMSDWKERKYISWVRREADIRLKIDFDSFIKAPTSDYIKVFKMWEVHEEVISNLNLPYSYKQMQQMLTVANDTGTRMLDITVTSPSPQEAMKIANEYAKVASQYIAETMSTDKPNIMSVALMPTNPVSPNKTRNVMLGALLGFALGAGFVTFRLITDDTYKTAEDIRKYTGFATLAVVPIEEGEAARSSKNGKKGKKQWKR